MEPGRARERIPLPSRVGDVLYLVALREAALTSKTRDALPDSAFVFPDKREYPIHDLAHGKAALSLGAQHETGARLAKIRAAVYRKYPQLKPDSGS
jgi:hypothetical protein